MKKTDKDIHNSQVTNDVDFLSINLDLFKMTPDGLELTGAMDALKESLRKYPTYDSLRKKYYDDFKASLFLKK